MHEVGIGERQGRERRGVLLGRAGIERPQLVGEHGERPEIGRDVMHGEPQGVFCRTKAQQDDAQQRSVLEVEGTVQLAPQPGRQRRAGQAGRRLQREADRHPLPHPLHRPAGAVVVGGAQRRVAVDQPLERPPQGRGVDVAREKRRGGDVVGGARRRHAVQEPERPLAVRERDLRRGAGVRGEPRAGARSGGEAPAQLHDEVAERRPVEQPGERHRRAEGRLDLLRELDGGERVEAEGDQRQRRIDALRRHPQRPRRALAQPGLERRRPGCGIHALLTRGDHRLLVHLRDRAARHHRELAVQVGGAAGVALDLAARGLGDRPHTQQYHLAGGDLVLAGDRGTNRRRDRRRLVSAIAGAPLDLLADHQALAVVPLHREGRPAARPQRRVRPLRRGLEVLRIEVAPAQDDEILEPAGHVELAVEDEAQVAGAQEGPGVRAVRAVRVAGQAGAEVALGVLGPPPVALRHARPGDPDLPDPAGGRGARGRRLDHLQPLPQPRPAAADERPAARLAVRHPLRPPLLERCRAHRAHRRRDPRRPAGREQRRLGEPEAGVERRAAETAGRESRGEPLQGLGADRLGAVERQPPARQVEPRLLLRGDLAHAQLVGEVRAAARGAAIAADRGQPAQRLLQERDRRHQHAARPQVERLEDVADQPHVVVERQPADDHRLPRLREGAADHLLVVQEVRVADHHPLGGRRRARGVLQEGEGVAVDPRRPPLRGPLGQPVDREPGERCRPDRPDRSIEERAGAAEQLPGGQHHAGPGVVEDRAQPGQAARRARRVRRHRHRSRVEAAEECADEFQAGWEQQEDPLPRRLQRRERGADPARLPLQLGEGDLRRLDLAVCQELVGDIVGAFRSPCLQQSDQRRPGSQINRIRIRIRHQETVFLPLDTKRVGALSSWMCSPLLHSFLPQLTNMSKMPPSLAGP